MTDLLDVDCAAEGGLLRIVALEMDTGGDVRDAVSRRGWVVAVGKRRVSGTLLRTKGRIKLAD